MILKEALLPLIAGALTLLFGYHFQYEVIECTCTDKVFTPKYETVNPELPEGHFRKKNYYLDAWTIKTEVDHKQIEAKCTQTEWDKMTIGNPILIYRERGTKEYYAKCK